MNVPARFCRALTSPPFSPLGEGTIFSVGATPSVENLLQLLPCLVWDVLVLFSVSYTRRLLIASR